MPESEFVTLQTALTLTPLELINTGTASAARTGITARPALCRLNSSCHPALTYCICEISRGEHEDTLCRLASYDFETEAAMLSSELVTLQIVLMLALEVTMIAAAATATKARMITYSTMS